MFFAKPQDIENIYKYERKILHLVYAMEIQRFLGILRLRVISTGANKYYSLWTNEVWF